MCRSSACEGLLKLDTDGVCEELSEACKYLDLVIERLKILNKSRILNSVSRLIVCTYGSASVLSPREDHARTGVRVQAGRGVRVRVQLPGVKRSASLAGSRNRQRVAASLSL
jgi:hypothetical protein